MSEFWWGVLALPLIALTIAAAVGALFGTWVLLEKWAEHRIVKLANLQLGKGMGDKFKYRTVTNLGGRGIMAGLILTAKSVRFFKISPGMGVAFISAPGPERGEAKLMRNAITNAVDELIKDEEVASSDTQS